MNKTKLLNLIADKVLSKNSISDPDAIVKNVTTNLQNTTASDVVFYKVNPKDEKSVENFKKRLNGTEPGLIIANEEAKDLVTKDNVVFVRSTEFLPLQKLMLDELFPNKHTLKMVGVTGTNGKTTTVNLAMQISSLIGHPAISIGTIGVQDMKGAVIEDIESTTPSYVELRKLIHRFQDKYETCFMEVSSHALVQERLYDVRLESAAWTSFSQDHLDYHRTMEEYFKAKLLIESKYLKDQKVMIVPHLEKELIEHLKKEAPKARVKIAKSLDERGYGKSIDERPLFYHSTYNQSNAEIALQLNAELYGEDKVKNIKLKDIKTPLGRFSVIELGNDNMAIVDYAHTPDALMNIGNAIKTAFPDHSLTVVFGCGGNRDKTKRPLMGKAVSDFAYKIIVTSDNPRD